MTEPLTVLLVEDNPGDARLIEEMLAEHDELPDRTDGGGGIELRRASRLDEALEELEPDVAGGEAGTSDASDESADSSDAAGETAEAADAADESGADDRTRGDGGARAEGAAPSAVTPHDVDVVLLDLNLPDSAGLDTLASVVEATELLPIIVLTGVSDREIGIEAIQRGAQDYLVKDEVTGSLLVRSIHYALERSRQERERARRRRQLEALNRHNRIAQDVTHAVITSATREELEQAVCDRLAGPDAYRFAWIGAVDRRSSTVTPRVTAGDADGYLDDVTITVDDAATSSGPTGTAVETKEVQVVDDVRSDPDYEPWRETALDHEFRSTAAIPIVHEELLYGVLNLYAETPSAFSEAEVEILERLGDVVGHAISALERKDALVRDTTLELEFRVQGVAEPLVDLATANDGTVSFESMIDTDGGVLAYGEVDGVPRDEFEATTAEMDAVEDARILGDGERRYDVEVVTTVARSLFEALPTHGGQIESATIGDGSFHLLVEFPHGRDTRRLTELVEENCPGATLQAQRTREHGEGAIPAMQSVDEDRLTEKQRTALETAYQAGHFEWPRETSGEELAERLGVSPATFHEHLRSAERKVFEQVFGTE